MTPDEARYAMAVGRWVLLSRDPERGYGLVQEVNRQTRETGLHEWRALVVWGQASGPEPRRGWYDVTELEFAPDLSTDNVASRPNRCTNFARRVRRKLWL